MQLFSLQRLRQSLLFEIISYITIDLFQLPFVPLGSFFHMLLKTGNVLL